MHYTIKINGKWYGDYKNDAIPHEQLEAEAIEHAKSILNQGAINVVVYNSNGLTVWTPEKRL
jgi:hypothetical protein